MHHAVSSCGKNSRHIFEKSNKLSSGRLWTINTGNFDRWNKGPVRKDGRKWRRTSRTYAGSCLKSQWFSRGCMSAASHAAKEELFPSIYSIYRVYTNASERVPLNRLTVQYYLLHHFPTRFPVIAAKICTVTPSWSMYMYRATQQ